MKRRYLLVIVILLVLLPITIFLISKARNDVISVKVEYTNNQEFWKIFDTNIQKIMGESSEIKVTSLYVGIKDTKIDTVFLQLYLDKCFQTVIWNRETGRMSFTTISKTYDESNNNSNCSYRSLFNILRTVPVETFLKNFDSSSVVQLGLYINNGTLTHTNEFENGHIYMISKDSLDVAELQEPITYIEQSVSLIVIENQHHDIFLLDGLSQ